MDVKTDFDFIKTLNPWWEKKTFKYDVFNRPAYLREIMDRKDRLIDILIGARRVGKTYILYSVVNRLLKHGISPKKIIFLSTDLREVKETGLRQIIADVIKLNKCKISDSLHMLVDEIQELDNWQSDLKTLYDHTKIKFYISGSSSLILTQKTSKLTGRYFLQKILPLSFSEFLNFNGVVVSRLSENKKKNLLEEYLKKGGYPEFVLKNNQTYLKQAIESTLYRDLLSLYGIRNPVILEDLLYYLADKITTPVSAKRIQKDLKIDDETAKFYLKYLESVYLVYPVYRKGRSNRISRSSNPKYYFNDTGVLSLMSIRPRMGHLVENVVFLELLRRESLREKYRIYYEIFDDMEIDFECKDGLFEVKTGMKPDGKILERYDFINKKINVVSMNILKKIKDFSANVKLIELGDFLR
ncbi:ATP-binding protein [Patescibacteria group bacterium]|nr:ATP-binding protein [Patescibacteria group bacterium]